MPRRYFATIGRQLHYNKEKMMNGAPYMSSEFVRGEVPLTHTVQESIDSLNAAIDRLDQIIKDMTNMIEKEQ